MKNVVLLYLLFAILLNANNIQVTSPTLTGQNLDQHATQIQFNLSWEHSWHDIVNWDAAWVFVKYKKNDGIWRHATIASAGYTAPAGAAIDVPSDGKGAFIYRGTLGSGSNNYTGVQVKWMYGTDGVSDNDLVTVKVFAIEMVYVPQAAFWVGDGDTNSSAKFRQYESSAPFQITSESAITLGGTSSDNLCLWSYSGYDFNETTTRILPASFPKGYNAFYCMKYEASEAQYADFLNCLTSTQASNRFTTSSTPLRYAITKEGNTFIAGRPDRACNYISVYDIGAYADWAGLRIMTELEYEKACRGDQYPIPAEYPFGTTAAAATTISGSEDGTETITNDGANCNYGRNPVEQLSGGDGGYGPLRCGIFAKSATTREQAGASYYGIMELSGNLDEYVIAVYNEESRAYSGLHGDGILSADGNSNTANWYYGGSHVLFRGGYYGSIERNLQVSERAYLGSGINDLMRFGFIGIRCVRSAPTGSSRDNYENSKLKRIN